MVLKPIYKIARVTLLMLTRKVSWRKNMPWESMPLSAIIVDRAEPSEALKATTVWSSGLSNPTYLLSSFQLEAFRRGQSPTEEWENKGEKGAYFLVDTLTFEGNQAKDWHIVADVNQSIVGIRSLAQAMDKGDIIDQVHKDIQKGTNKLIQLCAAADGVQLTNDKRTIMRHFSNTMFNIMRGGIFDANYQIEKADFLSYLQQANKVELKNLKINSINGMTCFHSSN